MAVIDLKLKTGELLAYDEETNVVSLNGKPTTRYKAAFIPDEKGDPAFFGFVSMTGIIYDVAGNQSRVVEEDKIKL